VDSVCIAVKDSSVLIDLVHGGLIEEWFDLNIETHVTDSVLNEMRIGSQAAIILSLIDQGMIKVHSIEEDEAASWLFSVQRIMVEHKVSFADAASLIYAQRIGAILMTGDGALRLAAKRLGVTVRGMLWILDILIWRDVISVHRALQCLELMQSNRARLPEKACSMRVQQWTSGERVKPKGI